MKKIICLVLSFGFVSLGISQDTITLAKGMFKEKMDCILLKDQNYDYIEAAAQLKLNGKKTYLDKGRIFRSMDDYWIASYLFNNTKEIFHLNAEACFDAVYINGKKVSHCKYIECPDPRNIIQHSQILTSYFDIPPGTYLLVAKISDFHLSHNFKPKLSDSTTFEAKTYIYEAKDIYTLIFFSSLFFLLSLIALSMHFSLKDKSFLFYSLFCLTIFFHFTRVLGEYYEVFDIVNKRIPWFYIKVPIYLCFYTFYSLFAAYFIDAKNKYRKEYNLMIVIIGLSFLLCIPEVYFLVKDLKDISYGYYFSVRFFSNITGVFFLYKIYKYRADIFVQIILIGGGGLLFSDLFSSYFETAQNKSVVFGGMLLELIAFTLGISYKIYFETKKRVIAEKGIQQKDETITHLKLATSQLSANFLQAQLNPHFIFNALNSIKYHILEKENDKASYYLALFARLMRNVLDHSALRSISLKKELDALALYIELESLRLNDQLEYILDINEDINLDMIKVPPFIIQPFVENVFLHAFKNKSKDCKLHIKIEEINEDIIITIVDNGPGITQEKLYKPDHVSKAIAITKDRLLEWGKLNNINSSVDFINKLNGENLVVGLEVKIVV